MEKKRRTGFRVAMIAVMAVILAVLILGNYLLLVVYPVSINNLFTVKSSEAADDGTTTREDWIALAENIEAEGVTLLRNENGTLPLAASQSSPMKVNLLGQRAYDPIYGGTGSGAGDSSSAISLVDALNANGFAVNPAIADSKIYAGKAEDDGSQIGWGDSKLELKDKPIADYTGDISFESMKAYSDVAIVVFGRAGGEGSDLISFEQTEGRHYLELSVNEEALIEKACQTFDTVIVLYNGANALELGFLETYDVDAALWIGDPGVYGFPAVAKILNGTINPSGRLVDTFAYDATSAPSYINYGEHIFSNSPEFEDESWGGKVINYAHYVDYVEGIYVGYRWYETAAAEGYIQDYNAAVQYPFGYGLSYTTFSQEIVGGTGSGSSIFANGEITLEVKVTNTGNVAGKDVVQLYYTAPYTDYDKNHGVEKSVVNLVSYAKTDLLEPGASQTLELTFYVEDMASYDQTHDNGDGTTGAYMLDEGTYTISLRANSHTVIDSIDVEMGSQHFYSGNDKRSTDNQAAYNQLQDSERGIYLSRKDGFANFNEAMASVTDVASDAILAELAKESTYDKTVYDDTVNQTFTAGKDYRVGEYTAKEGDLTLADLAGADYDDERWEKLISQMSLEEMAALIGNGGWSTVEIASIGKVATVDIDGPSGMSSMFDTNLKGIQYPATVVLAATWNADLPLQYGDCVADEGHGMGVSGWYAPAMNIHRSPFSGRNFEYYSEDPLVSGVVGAQTAYGARANGLYTYIKHFALNDQETNRADRLTTWSNEQASREIYLKPFEITVKEGHASALMTSMNHIGATWAGNKPGVLSEILRNEWGFQGMAITDACVGSFMSGPGAADVGVRTGQDLWLGMGGVAVNTNTDADIYYVMRSVKNILYTQANASLIPSHVLPWRTVLYVLDGLLAAGFVACGVLLVLDIRKYSKKRV